MNRPQIISMILNTGWLPVSGKTDGCSLQGTD